MSNFALVQSTGENIVVAVTVIGTVVIFFALAFLFVWWRLSRAGKPKPVYRPSTAQELANQKEAERQQRWREQAYGAQLYTQQMRQQSQDRGY